MVNKHYSVISWFSGEPNETSRIAHNILNSIENDENEDLFIDAKIFYQDVASKKCHFSGRDGDHNWSWSTYSRMGVQAILTHIKPFFMKLWEQDILSQYHAVMGIDQDEMSNYTTFYILTNRGKLNSWRNNQVKWFYEEFIEPETEWQYDIDNTDQGSIIEIKETEITTDDMNYNFICSQCDRGFMNAVVGDECPYCNEGIIMRK